MAKCPHCQVDLKLEGAHILNVLACPGCHGELVPEDSFNAVRRHADPNWTADDKKRFFEQAAVSSEAERIRCPECRGRMEKEVAGPQGAVNIHHCHSCRLYWFGAGEVEKLQISYADAMMNLTPEALAKMEQLARVGLALEVRKEHLGGYGDEMRMLELPTRPWNKVPISSARGVSVLPILSAVLAVFHNVWAMDRQVKEAEAAGERVLAGLPADPPDEVWSLFEAMTGTWAGRLALAGIIVVIVLGAWLLLRRW